MKCLKYWKEKNDELLNKAIDVLADAVIDMYVDSDDLVGATDLEECDGDDIQNIYDIMIYDRRYPDFEPFSIKEFYQKNKGYGCRHIPFEIYVSENWEDILDDELIEAVRDRVKVGEVINKYAFGGGGFEVHRDLELGVKDKVAEKLKIKFKQK